MDAQGSLTDAEGLAFLADVLGTASVDPQRRFPIERWVPTVSIRPGLRVVIDLAETACLAPAE